VDGGSEGVGGQRLDFDSDDDGGDEYEFNADDELGGLEDADDGDETYWATNQVSGVGSSGGRGR
jgi:hypothetical protein